MTVSVTQRVSIQADFLLRQKGFCRLALSIPKGHTCNLGVYKISFAVRVQDGKFYGSFPPPGRFFSMFKDLETRAVMGSMLAYILNG